MTRILLAGYGNIAQAFEKILHEQEPDGSYSLGICDLANGNDIMQFLPLHHHQYDLVVNTSLANSMRLAELCAELGIDYIDVGIEDGLDELQSAHDYIDLYNHALQLPTPRSRVLMGFGINPGILEHIYQKHRPATPHYAFELEHDDATSAETQLFHTWSPFMYVEESVFSDNILLGMDARRKPYVVTMNGRMAADGGTIPLAYHGQVRRYVPVAHEELLAMAYSDANCLGMAYLFQAPKGIQTYCLERGRTISASEAQAIPVLHHCQGTDEVGMAFWDLSDNIYWVKNVTRNEATWQRYGVNAVCWQTATGLWIGYKLLHLLPCTRPHTFTHLSRQHPEEIDRLLQQIGLTFEREDHVFAPEELREKVVRHFQQ